MIKERTYYMNLVKVLMVGSDLSVKGGMTTVVNSFLNNKFNNSDINFIPTHIENVGAMKKMLFFIRSIFKILGNLISNNIDIIHIHLSERGSFFRKFVVVIIGRVFRKKIVLHLHGANFKEFYNNNKFLQKSIRYILLKADSVIVLGDSWNEFVKSIDSSINTYILRNSVKCSNEIVNYDGINVRLLFLAVLIKRKGIFDLINAVSKIKDDIDLVNYNIKFIIAGTGEDEKDVKSLVSKLGVDNYFDFKGWVNGRQKVDLIKDSQIMVLPSYNEGLPVSILEAMSYGMPVITTDVGSIKDAVKNEVNGILIDPGDIDKLYLSIKELIINKHKWDEYSRNSKKIISEMYDQDVYFTKIEGLYNSLVKVH
ncbi:MAG TPA: glycosyltransferase family 1 protein [Clostridium sp.]|nr:glycosyltransferase family 1 protein [Clostridium sp.]